MALAGRSLTLRPRGRRSARKFARLSRDGEAKRRRAIGWMTTHAGALTFAPASQPGPVKGGERVAASLLRAPRRSQIVNDNGGCPRAPVGAGSESLLSQAAAKPC